MATTYIYSLLTVPPLFLIYQLIVLMAIEGVESIGCFVCSSFNGSNPSCEDSFNSSIQYVSQHIASSTTHYQHPCWAFKKQRQGLFPADHCIKVNGHRSDHPSQTMVIRTCALDSGTLTADTEIVRISHCGHFKYEGHQYSGCVQACDTDGCNEATTIHQNVFSLYLIAFICIVASFMLSSFNCSTYDDHQKAIKHSNSNTPLTGRLPTSQLILPLRPPTSLSTSLSTSPLLSPEIS